MSNLFPNIKEELPLLLDQLWSVHVEHLGVHGYGTVTEFRYMSYNCTSSQQAEYRIIPALYLPFSSLFHRKIVPGAFPCGASPPDCTVFSPYRPRHFPRRPGQLGYLRNLAASPMSTPCCLNLGHPGTSISCNAKEVVLDGE